MKYFTGDESGLIKWIAFPPKSEEKPAKKAKTEEEQETKLQPLLGVFGKVDKEKSVQQLTWATLNKEKLLLVGRKNGTIQFLSPENGEVKKEFINEHVGTEDKQGRFIGLFIHNDHLVACTSTGDLSYTSLKSKKTNTETILDLGANLEVMRGHSTQTHLFAIGGKDRDLTIYDLNALVVKKTRSKKNNAATKEEDENTSPHKNKIEKKIGVVFQAKNVKNDFLDLQQPVWIHDLQFMNKEGTKIAVATHYHQLRVYDTKEGRRPILNKEIGKQPLKVLSVGTDFDHVLFADTMSTVGMLNIHTGKTAALFKGFTGAATDLLTVPPPRFDDQDSKERWVASVSLDRFLRVHETATVYRRIENKAYVKQRLTCVLVDEDYEYPVPKKTKEEEEEEEDAMWESMELAKDRKRKHT